MWLFAVLDFLNLAAFERLWDDDAGELLAAIQQGTGTGC
jgi:hypothetical protein